jgi:hypothetical protein
MNRICAIILLLLMTGCIATYRDFPVGALDKKPEIGACYVMYYKIDRFDILDMGGYDELQRIFRKGGICKKTLPVDAPPEKGFFVEVETHWKPMTMPALVFGYLSLSTLTILPAWSTHDGYIVKYKVFIDGNKKETYDYEITRKVGLWLGLIPFAWANFITYSEKDAFTATTYQFIHDAQPYLASQ